MRGKYGGCGYERYSANEKLQMTGTTNFMTNLTIANMCLVILHTKNGGNYHMLFDEFLYKVF